MKRFINKPLFIVAVVVTLIAGLEIPFNTFSYSLIFYMIQTKKVALIVPLTLLVVGGYAFFGTMSYVKSKVVNTNIVQINRKLKATYVLNTMRSVGKVNKDNYEADGVSFFLNDLKLLEDNYWRKLFALLTAVVTAIGTLVIAMTSNWLLTLIFLAFTVVPTFVPKLFTKKIQARTDSWSQKNQGLSTTVRDLLHGALLLTRFNSLHGFNHRLNQSVEGVEVANANLKNEIAFSNALIGFLFYAFSYVPIGLGVYFTITGKILLAQFVAIQYSSSWILNSFNTIVSSINTLNSTKQIKEKVLATGEPEKGMQTTETVPTFKNLSLTGLSFAYEKTPIFKNLNLSVQAGEKVLIRGQSGIGKSTLIRILLKELTPAEGRLRLNGTDYTQAEAYATIGIVGQEPIIFRDTIKRNLTLGQSYSEEQIELALRQAGLAQFATATGLNHVINENGGNLSGGQLKRIEIARALLFNKQVLVIDEGTASLDPQTAAAIHRTILSVPGLTVIEVDHNISAETSALYTSHYVLKNHELVKA